MIIYKLKGGAYVSRSEVEMAYYIATGRNCWESESNFLLWLDSVWGKAIIATYNEDTITVEELVKQNQIVFACRLYKAKHNCTLSEAKAVIDKMRD